jgi:hypothetical protein
MELPGAMPTAGMGRIPGVPTVEAACPPHEEGSNASKKGLAVRLANPAPG